MNNKLQIILIVVGTFILAGCIPTGSGVTPSPAPMGDETMEPMAEPAVEEMGEPAAEPMADPAMEEETEPAAEPEMEESEPEIN
ncbi:hypothetical protein ACFL6E_06320 [Candidatus Neomarinimicrobiota bacterium]